MFNSVFFGKPPVSPAEVYAWQGRGMFTTSSHKICLEKVWKTPTPVLLPDLVGEQMWLYWKVYRPVQLVNCRARLTYATLQTDVQPFLPWPVTSFNSVCYIFSFPLITIMLPVAFSEIYHCCANQGYFKPHQRNSPGCAAVEIKVISASSLSISCPCSPCCWEGEIPPRGSVGGKPKRSWGMDELTVYSDIFPLTYQFRLRDVCIYVNCRCTVLKKGYSRMNPPALHTSSNAEMLCVKERRKEDFYHVNKISSNRRQRALEQTWKHKARLLMSSHRASICGYWISVK